MSNITLYSEAQAALEEFRSKFVGRVYDVTTTDGMKDAKAARREVREARTSLEKKRQELKAPLLEKERALDGQAKQLTAALLEIEQPIDELIKAEEARAARAKAEEARKERLRIEAIQDQIAWMTEQVPFGASAVMVMEKITKLEAVVVSEEFFGEFTEDAAAARIAGLDALAAVMKDIKQREDEEAERREQARVAGIKARIDSLNLPIPFGVTVDQLTDLRVRLEAVEITEADFGEFCAAAAAARRAGLGAVSGALDVLVARQAQDEEAARLREAEEARKAGDDEAAAAEDAESKLNAWDDRIAEAETADTTLANQDGPVRFTEAPAPAGPGQLDPGVCLAVISGAWPTVIGWLKDFDAIGPCDPASGICYCEIRDAVEVIEAALVGRYTEWYGGGARGTCLNPVNRPLDDSEASK